MLKIRVVCFSYTSFLFQIIDACSSCKTIVAPDFFKYHFFKFVYSHFYFNKQLCILGPYPFNLTYASNRLREEGGECFGDLYFLSVELFKRVYML